MKALEVQLHHELQRFQAKEKSIESIFIGGGTPSTVERGLYTNIFKILKPYLQESIEITSEANPNSATKEWLKGMQELGVNRISFGVQSFNKDTSVRVKTVVDGSTFLDANLANCMFTKRINTADVFTQTFDYRLVGNPANLSTVITY
jgi:coproporphyrinogen III oxidase-like Fe-S oxidoreductase